MIRRDPSLQRLIDALHPPYPDHLKLSATPAGRYLAHIEDDPQVWEQTFADQDRAQEAMVWSVRDRIRRNGAGWGAVIDTRTNAVIATKEISMAGAVAALDLPNRIVLYLR